MAAAAAAAAPRRRRGAAGGSARWLCWLWLLAATPGDAGGSDVEGRVQQALQELVEEMSARYNMSIAAGFHSSKLQLAAAAGFTDAGLDMGTPRRLAQPGDLYVWGSTTKMFTAPAVLQLVERGAVGLEDPIVKHINPILQQLNGTNLQDRFGEAIADVQVQHLLHMTSGIGDYDGAEFTVDQFRNRSKAFGPVEILSRYVPPELSFSPGSRQTYCSTNYILLGLILANHYHSPGSAWSWHDYDQLTVVPAPLRAAYGRSIFVQRGACEEHTPVHGFMERYPESTLPPQDVWNVSCVGGWTAGNYVGSVGDLARFTYQLYNRQRPGIVSASSQALLTNFTAPSPGPFHRHFKFYGMGTFSLDWSVGDAEAYGHVGDTYGYQSQTTYFPELDIVLAIATNVETAKQIQPAEATCIGYHRLATVLAGKPTATCRFVVPYRFIGTCMCRYGSEPDGDVLLV